MCGWFAESKRNYSQLHEMAVKDLNDSASDYGLRHL